MHVGKKNTRAAMEWNIKLKGSIGRTGTGLKWRLAKLPRYAMGRRGDMHHVSKGASEGHIGRPGKVKGRSADDARREPNV